MLDVPTSKRDRILEAAAEQIVANGLQCSMAAIAEVAGVATGSLYNYFASKTALVQGVYADIGEKMAQAVMADHPPEAGHEARIRGYIDSYITFLLADARRQRLFEYLDSAPELSQTEIASAFSSFLSYSASLFSAAQQAGVLREGSPYLLGSFVRGAIRHSVKRRRMVDAKPITRAEAAAIADMCWRAISRD